MKLQADIFEQDRDYFVFMYGNYWWFNIHYDQLPAYIRSLSDQGQESFAIEFNYDEMYGEYRIQYHPTDDEMLEIYTTDDRLVTVAHVDLIEPHHHERLKEDGVGYLETKVIVE